MDVNLTGQVAANLIQNPIMIVSAGSIGGFVTGVITLFGVIWTIKYYEKRDEQKRENEMQIERRNAYIQLSSQKKLSQLYFSRFESRVHSKYHLISKIQENQKTPKGDVEFHMEQQIYWMQRGNELNDRLYLEEKRLFEIIGLISLLFPRTEDLTTLINRIYEIRTLTLMSPCELPNNLVELESWKDDKLRELSEKVREEYLQPIEDLLNYLNKYIEKESRMEKEG